MAPGRPGVPSLDRVAESQPPRRQPSEPAPPTTGSQGCDPQGGGLNGPGPEHGSGPVGLCRPKPGRWITHPREAALARPSPEHGSGPVGPGRGPGRAPGTPKRRVRGGSPSANPFCTKVAARRGPGWLDRGTDGLLIRLGGASKRAGCPIPRSQTSFLTSLIASRGWSQGLPVTRGAWTGIATRGDRWCSQC